MPYPADDWRIKAYHVDLGGGEDYAPPLTPTGNPKIGHDYKDTFSAPYTNEVNLDDHIFRRTLVLKLNMMTILRLVKSPTALSGLSVGLSQLRPMLMQIVAFAKVDTDFVSGGDPEHDDIDFAGRPKTLVPMS